MATKMAPVSGSYKQTVPDPDADQADNKFGGYGGSSSVKDSGKHDYNQKSQSPKDSGA